MVQKSLELASLENSISRYESLINIYSTVLNNAGKLLKGQRISYESNNAADASADCTIQQRTFKNVSMSGLPDIVTQVQRVSEKRNEIEEQLKYFSNPINLFRHRSDKPSIKSCLDFLVSYQNELKEKEIFKIWTDNSPANENRIIINPDLIKNLYVKVQ